jgi:acyl-CoA synthetase (AMP-forming)/AMP-acid ligase II
VLRPGHELSAEELGSRLKSQLSAYKLPRHITFFAEGSLPYTATGKIDKPRLTTILVQDLSEGAQ